MFSGKTLAQALALAMQTIGNNHAFIAYARTNKAHKARWVRAADALERKDFDRVKAYMAESGDARKAAWAAVKAKEAPAKPAQAKAAAKPAKPSPAKAPAKAKPAQVKPAQAAPAQGQLSDSDVLRIAQLVANMLTGKKVA